MNWLKNLKNRWGQQQKPGQDLTNEIPTPFFFAKTIDAVQQHFADYNTSTDPYLQLEGALPGRCFVCRKDVLFEVERPKNAEQVNWRETLKCPHCHLINRWRGCLHLFETVCKPTQSDRIYITEALTPVYEVLSGTYANLASSEFIPQSQPGEMVEVHSRTVRNEDVTNLTFETGSFDSLLSFDVLEHVPNYQRALEEFYRVLDSGGHLILTAPFSFQTGTQVRATVDEEGVVTHLMEPCYHGDPLSDEGVLAYYDFGMELLDQLNDVGFKDSSLACYWSNDWGYPAANVAFVARKP